MGRWCTAHVDLLVRLRTRPGNGPDHPINHHQVARNCRSGRWTKPVQAGIIFVVQEDSPKAGWVEGLPVGEPAKASLGRLVDIDHDPAEETFYEAAADPQFVQLERQQRQFREMFRRRLRHLSAKKR